MRTEPPFNLNEPFPNPKEVKPIREIGKPKPFDPRDKKENPPKKSEKPDEEDEEEKKKPPNNDPTGNLGNELDNTI
jgi:hypothetical protein